MREYNPLHRSSYPDPVKGGMVLGCCCLLLDDGIWMMTDHLDRGEAVKNSDLVIEAIIESLKVKSDLFGFLDSKAKYVLTTFFILGRRIERRIY